MDGGSCWLTFGSFSPLVSNVHDDERMGFSGSCNVMHMHHTKRLLATGCGLQASRLLAEGLRTQGGMTGFPSYESIMLARTRRSEERRLFFLSEYFSPLSLACGALYRVPPSPSGLRNDAERTHYALSLIAQCISRERCGNGLSEYIYVYSGFVLFGRGREIQQHHSALRNALRISLSLRVCACLEWSIWVVIRSTIIAIIIAVMLYHQGCTWDFAGSERGY